MTSGVRGSLLCALVIFATEKAEAGGLLVPGVGPQAQARAGAFVAKADDPSALAHNPAGIAQLDGTHVLLGANFLGYSLSYQRFGQYETTTHAHAYEGKPYPRVEDQSSPSFGLLGLQLIPLLAVTTDGGLDLPLRLAAGVYAPQGYPTRQFKNSYALGSADDPAPAPQRYDIIEQEIVAAMPSLAISYSPTDWIDIGVRATWGFVSFKTKTSVWGVRNYEEAIERDGFVALEATDSFVPGWGLGVMVRPHPSWEMGLSYSSPLDIWAEGTAQGAVGSDAGIPGIQEVIEPITDPDAVRCKTGGEIGALAACADLTLPQTVTGGVRWLWKKDGVERADVELDLRWEDWSAGSVYKGYVDGRSGTTGIPLQPVYIRHGTQDVLSIRLGGAYRIDLPVGHLQLRAGAAYDTATVPNSWTRVDLDGAERFTLAGGIAYEASWFRVELGCGGVIEPSRSVAQCAPPDGPSATSPGCEGDGQDTSVAHRKAPDPLQPLEKPDAQAQSPFNAGDYESGYFMMSMGFTVWF